MPPENEVRNSRRVSIVGFAFTKYNEGGNIIQYNEYLFKKVMEAVLTISVSYLFSSSLPPIEYANMQANILGFMLGCIRACGKV